MEDIKNCFSFFIEILFSFFFLDQDSVFFLLLGHILVFFPFFLVERVFSFLKFILYKFPPRQANCQNRLGINKDGRPSAKFASLHMYIIQDCYSNRSKIYAQLGRSCRRLNCNLSLNFILQHNRQSLV